VVHVATTVSGGIRVSVKCISSHDEEIRQFTREEYKLMRSLSHPAIVCPNAFFESSCRQMILMELFSEGSVEQYVSRHGPFAEGNAKASFQQFLAGVSYLHSQRVVHRDLKPDNLLLTDGCEQLKITDFNSATRIGCPSGKCVMLTDRGTKLYAAPELRFGLMWNERIDIWAAGFCLYFMLRGKVPFDNGDPEVSSALRAGRVPEIKWGRITPTAKSLIQTSLMHDMRDRPPAMELLLHNFFVGNVADCYTKQEEVQETVIGDIVVGPPCEQSSLMEIDSLHAWLPCCGIVSLCSSRRPRLSDQSGGSTTAKNLQELDGEAIPLFEAACSRARACRVSHGCGTWLALARRTEGSGRKRGRHASLQFSAKPDAPLASTRRRSWEVSGKGSANAQSTRPTLQFRVSSERGAEGLNEVLHLLVQRKMQREVGKSLST